MGWRRGWGGENGCDGIMGLGGKGMGWGDGWWGLGVERGWGGEMVWDGEGDGVERVVVMEEWDWVEGDGVGEMGLGGRGWDGEGVGVEVWM